MHEREATTATYVISRNRYVVVQMSKPGHYALQIGQIRKNDMNLGKSVAGGRETVHQEGGTRARSVHSAAGVTES